MSRNESFRRFAKFLCLAQAASDAGKGCKSMGNNASNAVAAGYDLKDQYIRQAIAEAKRSRHCVVLSKGEDFTSVIYFDIKGYGQVSFHTFAPSSVWENLPDGIWTGVTGESYGVCRRLNKELNLQVW